MTEPSKWDEVITEILDRVYLFGMNGGLGYEKFENELSPKDAKQAINQAVKAHIIADIIGMCLETKHPGEFPSVEALMIRDKIVLKYLVTKGNE